MPRVVATFAAQAGEPVRAEDLLLPIRVMKMVTGNHANCDCTTKVIHVQPGALTEAKKLLIELG